ncbi:MAG: 2-C-methyl-D-erythritol 4-phosphate cytidylyltransferase [Dehalococcoidia bacterium]|nr:2-C-methyl-D-erythritol 4-phosphate cytidylyltransferase [Dehalococcoidia bacterium]
MDRVGAIVPAAGHSVRMRGIDKLFTPLLNRPLLAWCVDVLEGHATITRIALSIRRERWDEAQSLCVAAGWKKTCLVVGGERRQDSVARALNVLGDVDWVLVHDGDRPFLDDQLIETGLRFARETGVAVAAIPVTDTVKMVNADGLVASTPQRDSLRAVQTPQVFRADVFRHAYSCLRETVTDDAMLAERLGYSVRLYPGSTENIKVTTPDDLLIAAEIARRREARQ